MPALHAFFRRVILRKPSDSSNYIHSRPTGSRIARSKANDDIEGGLRIKITVDRSIEMTSHNAGGQGSERDLISDDSGIGQT